MVKRMKELVIPKDKAVFRLDGNGRWYNKFGRFQHKKIIDYFHACIRRDQDGYYLFQIRDDIREKVYFSYEDTALFVFDVIRNIDVVLILNTQKKVKLKPKKLCIKNDHLFMLNGDELLKFSERSLTKIADLLEQENDDYFIRFKGRRYRIKPM